MNHRLQRASLTVAVTLALAVSVPASLLAHGGATGIVKERMDLMVAIDGAGKVLSQMLRGETAYDPAKVREAAEIIGSHSGEAMTRLFPEGSTQSPTEATAAVWEAWERFSELADDLADYAGALETAADNPRRADTDIPQPVPGIDLVPADELSAFAPETVIGFMSQTCDACHTEFRKRD